MIYAGYLLEVITQNEVFYLKKRVLSLMLAVMILLLSAAMIPAGAFTVEKDGKQYTFVSHTPTTGDCKVLMIRVGFEDYPVDDEIYNADSEETLLSYFDGSDGSVNAFYEASSYGKLRLSCDEVFTYTFPGSRDECSANRLPELALGALESEIDFDSYDSNDDGYLDFVAFDFAGPATGWGTDWWSHVTTSDVSGIGGKSVDHYSVLRGKATVFIHEFGHILGAPDYYSYHDGQPSAIMTYDLMNNNTGDHEALPSGSTAGLTTTISPM